MTHKCGWSEEKSTPLHSPWMRVLSAVRLDSGKKVWQAENNILNQYFRIIKAWGLRGASSLFHPSIHKTFIQQQRRQEIIISPPSLLLCAAAEWRRRHFEQKYSRAKAINSKYLCNFLSYRLNIFFSFFLSFFFLEKREHFIFGRNYTSSRSLLVCDELPHPTSACMCQHTTQQINVHSHLLWPPQPLSIHTHTHTQQPSYYSSGEQAVPWGIKLSSDYYSETVPSAAWLSHGVPNYGRTFKRSFPDTTASGFRLHRFWSGM